MTFHRLAGLAFALLPASAAHAQHLLDHAFMLGGSRAVPMDIQSIELALSFDARAKTAVGSARIVFVAPDQGLPYFTMGPAPVEVKLDSVDVEIRDVSSPDERAQVRVVDREVATGATHTLELGYRLSRRQVRLGGGRVGFLTAMNDIGRSGNYFEAYGPSNIEADAYAMTLLLETSGTRELPLLFANGEVEELSADPPAWRVEFPAWYTTSSFYVHLTNARQHVLQDVIVGAEKAIPVTVYSRSLRKAQRAMEMLPDVFEELEEAYGPYLHDSFIALMSGRGGMEHCGATISDLDSLAHEVTHSWFARGVMPSSGRDGWMDEAVASWRDYGYERSSPDPFRDSTNMAGFSIFDPFAPGNVYEDGRALLAELDDMFASSHGGLRPVLRLWYEEAKGRAVSTEDFLAFLEEQADQPIAPIFDRFVYGNGAEAGAGPSARTHPPKLSRAEIRRIR